MGTRRGRATSTRQWATFDAHHYDHFSSQRIRLARSNPVHGLLWPGRRFGGAVAPVSRGFPGCPGRHPQGHNRNVRAPTGADGGTALSIRVAVCSRRKKVLAELGKIAHVVAALWSDPKGKLAIRLFFTYIVGVAKVKEADVRDALQEYIEPYLDPEMVAVWTQYEAGEKQGERRGERKTLQRQLAQRFGALSAAHLERLEAASLEELDDMTLRVLTAASVEEVLGMRGRDE